MDSDAYTIILIFDAPGSSILCSSLSVSKRTKKDTENREEMITEVEINFWK